jgi:hypothetical protein
MDMQIDEPRQEKLTILKLGQVALARCLSFDRGEARVIPREDLGYSTSRVDQDKDIFQRFESSTCWRVKRSSRNHPAWHWLIPPHQAMGCQYVVARARQAIPSASKASSLSRPT